MPAAAVIPALIAYTKVVAVKKLVVEFWPWSMRFGLHWSVPQWTGLHLLDSQLSFRWQLVNQNFYFEKIGVFKAGFQA